MRDAGPLARALTAREPGPPPPVVPPFPEGVVRGRGRSSSATRFAALASSKQVRAFVPSTSGAACTGLCSS